MTKKFERWATSWQLKLVSALIGAVSLIIISLIGVAYAQVLAGQKDNKQDIKDHCIKVDAELNLKADKHHIDSILEIIQEEQRTAKGERKEVLKSIQNLNINVILLNERLKDK